MDRHQCCCIVEMRPNDRVLLQDCWYETCLPIIAVNDIWVNLQSRHRLDSGPTKKSEAFGIIWVITSFISVETFPVKIFRLVNEPNGGITTRQFGFQKAATDYLGGSNVNGEADICRNNAEPSRVNTSKGRHDDRDTMPQSIDPIR